MNKIIFIFLDGFGLGKNSTHNPHSRINLPFLHSQIGSVLLEGVRIEKPELLLKDIDANLGVPGIPQSATGQTALFTGVNAAKLLGFHYPAFPNKKLVEIISAENIYTKAHGIGKTCLFANAYSLLYFQYVQEKKRRHSVTTHCLLAAGLPILTLEDMKQGRAVFWDMTRRALASYPIDEKFPVISGAEAGRHLAGCAGTHDLVVFECFLPDLIGHAKDLSRARDFLLLFDEFLSSVVENTDDTTSVLVSSDHGNIEDLKTGLHTTNPVPLLLIGKAAGYFSSAASLTDVTPCILDALAET